MDTQTLCEWQRIDPENGLVEPWWTHPFMDYLKTWNLSQVSWLEFGAGRSTAWLRSKCSFVVSIEANTEWAEQAKVDILSAGINLGNGVIRCDNISDGIPGEMKKYFDLIPEGPKFDIISVDGIYRNECLLWALDHFKGRGGIIIADNWQQDYVWISEAAERLMAPYPICRFFQQDHTNHEGKAWNTVYWVV